MPPDVVWEATSVTVAAIVLVLTETRTELIQAVALSDGRGPP